MREIAKISEALFEKIRDRFDDVSLGDENAKAVQKPEDARFFNFDYSVEGKNFGNVTISIIDETSLKIYFSKNISDGLDDEQKTKWYAFLRELREFAKRNLLSFEPRDITRSTLKHRDIQQVSKADSTYSADEVIGEGRMYGNKHTSFEDRSSARIIVRHTESVDPEKRGARSRKIKAIFVETSEGERFKMPHKNLRYARAMARHISEGGQMNDDFGQHITQIAEECSKLRPFRNSMRRRTFEDAETTDIVEAAFEYHAQLNNTLKRISGRKGYQSCKENYQTEELILDEFDSKSMRERFVKRSYNEQMDDALPIVQKAYKMKKENKYSANFEKWATHVTEGSWALPSADNLDGLLELMADPLPLGIDGMNATSALYDIIGDDSLFDALGDAAEENPEEDARPLILDWLKNNMPEVFDKLGVDEEQYQNDLDDYMDQPVNQSNEFVPDVNGYNESEEDEDSNSEFERGGILDEKDEQWDNSDLTPNQPDYNSNETQSSVDSITSAIINRIVRGKHSELLRKLGPDGVMEAAREKAEWIGEVDEIGSSDISIWVRDIEREHGITELSESKINELSKKTLGSYVKKAHKDSKGKNIRLGKRWNDDEARKVWNHEDGIERAVDRLTKDNVSEGKVKEMSMDLDELTDAEFTKKYKITKAEARLTKDNVSEGKVKELSMDLEELTDAEFKKKYNMTKAEAKKGLNESTEGAPDIKAVYAKIKDWDYKALKGYARKVGVWDEAVNSLGRGDESQIIDEILGELFGDYDQRDLLDADTMFNESLAQIRKIAGLK